MPFWTVDPSKLPRSALETVLSNLEKLCGSSASSRGRLKLEFCRFCSGTLIESFSDCKCEDFVLFDISVSFEARKFLVLGTSRAKGEPSFHRELARGLYAGRHAAIK